MASPAAAADDITAWAPSPHSSILTTSLCVYSSLHLNVPPPGRSHKRRLLEKLPWTVVAVLAGEIVVFTAFAQAYAAWRLQRDLARLSSTTTAAEDEEGRRYLPSSRSMTMTTAKYHQLQGEQRRLWGPRHCQFAVMGGFAVAWPSSMRDQANNTRGGEDDDYASPILLITLTPRGIHALAQAGQLPRITEAQIKDKSKPESIGKAIVCIQIVWAVAQVVSRLAAQLPITLLELVMVGQIIRAIATYGLWWHKPYDVMEPPDDPVAPKYDGPSRVSVSHTTNMAFWRLTRIS
ncbi:hypothetical protein PG994_004146 [Apiospora phragmitis]|uniref:Uncharacterized protein n=1 Tax=Apiospora phragmitis TaxID=2905665 RepID=A0ABR1VPW7_9PEZI